jgi:hypothetical protein
VTDYLYPSTAELAMIAQTKIPRLTAQRPIFDAPLLMWEQMDNYTGLQQIRGLNGEPPKVTRTGAKRYTEEPGIYGEFEWIDERELTMRRQWGSFNAPIDLSDLVMMSQDKLLGRRLDRIEKTLWDLVIAGTFSVAGPTGATLAYGAYTTQTYNASTWSTHTTAVPLADLQAVQLKARGYSVNFGAAARAYMNRSTLNDLLQNTNTADVYGRRTAGLGTFNSQPQMNALFAGDDLPQIVVYDEGYLDDSATFQLFIPNGTVVVIGQRPAGQSVGEYRMTRNANNPGMAPGPYMRVLDDPDDIPRSIQVHDGHNGGPVIYFPSAIVVMDVS